MSDKGHNMAQSSPEDVRGQFDAVQAREIARMSFELRAGLLDAVNSFLSLALTLDVIDLQEARRSIGHAPMRRCMVNPATAGSIDGLVRDTRTISVLLQQTLLSGGFRRLAVHFPVSAESLPTINGDLTPDQYPKVNEVYLFKSRIDERGTFSDEGCFRVDTRGIDLYQPDATTLEAFDAEIERLTGSEAYRAASARPAAYLDVLGRTREDLLDMDIIPQALDERAVAA